MLQRGRPEEPTPPDRRPFFPATLPQPPRLHLPLELPPPCRAAAPLTHLRHQLHPKRPSAIQHLEEVAETLSRKLAETHKRLADTQAQVVAPFEYAAKLASLGQRQQEIEDALDLTKNHAPAQLAAE